MTKWIIQSNLIKDEVLKEFRNAFTELGIAFELIMVIPFSTELPAFDASEVNIFYGSTTLMLNAYAVEKFRTGIFYDADRFTIANYLDKWKGKMLNEGGVVLPFGVFVNEMVDARLKWFIRPNNDDKTFSGAVMSSLEIRDWYLKIQDIGNPDLNPHTLIFVSEERVITKEWRNFIVDGKVIDSSRYILNNELDISRTDIPTKMIQFVEEAALLYSPHSIFVMDVAQIDQGFKIIECNCFNGTGFYKHYIKKIVKAITESVDEK